MVSVSGKWSISFLRLGIVLLSMTVLIFLAHTFVSYAVKSRLQKFDGESTFDGIEYGFNSIIVRNLRMPGIGISSGETFVLLGRTSFHPVPVHVVLKSVVINPNSSGNSSGSVSGSVDLPVISVLDGYLPAYDTSVLGTRINGTDIGFASGQWGEVFVNHLEDSISVVFKNCSGIPGMDDAVPYMARGHSVSGTCSGILSPSPSISGFITELDGETASAAFEYRLDDGKPSACLSMDFSQVADPAMLLLDSLSSGAIMTAIPAGSLTVSFSGNDTIHFSTDLQFDSLSIFSTSVAPDTFSVDVAFSCGGFILLDSETLVIDSGTINSSELGLAFNLMYSWGDHRKLSIALSNPALSGEGLTHSIPTELLGDLDGLALGGELSIFAELTLDWDYPDSSDVNLDIDASRLTVVYSPITFGRISSCNGAECLMQDSWGNRAMIGLDTLTNPEFVAFDSLPFSFEPLLRCAEDASFRNHHGFSEYHIRNSIRANMSQGHFVRGGSTISMQLAKNLFLGREKTLARKLQEVFLTWRIEQYLSKDRILEIYANIVELGPGVFGFNSAAKYYFNVSVSDLSIKEMAFLVSILPGPRLYHRYAVQGVLPPHWESYVDRLISISADRGWMDETIASEAVLETLIFDGAVSLL